MTWRSRWYISAKQHNKLTTRLAYTLFVFCLLLLCGSHGRAVANAPVHPAPASRAAVSPQLGFSTFLGTAGSTGFSELWESVYDSAGNIVVIGFGDFDPNDYPGVPVTIIGKVDNSTLIVAKLSPDGAHLRWVTFIGGSGMIKEADGIAIDQADNLYLVASTWEADFPTTAGSFQPQYKGGGDGVEIVLAKLAADGKQLIYATYLGGSQHDTARGGLAVDNQGYAYVVGMTASPDFLDKNGVTNPAKVNSYIGGVGDGFIAKIAQDGAAIVYARFIGSPTDTLYDGDVMVGVQVDGQGYAYLGGFVRGDGALVTADAYDKTYNGGSADVYYAKLSPDGKEVVYATYLGGSGEDDVNHRIALDSQGNVYLTGNITSSDFPLLHARDTTYGGDFDGFLVKFDQHGQLVFSTYIGGTGENETLGPAIDAAGNIFVVAYTETGDIEVTPTAYDDTYNGGRDIVLQQYSPTGQLLYSSFLGGSAFDRARLVAPDQAGNPVVVGYTQSSDFPTSAGAYDRAYNGGYDIFVAQFVTGTLGQTPPSAVLLTGPLVGQPETPYSFTAMINPLTATLPITYVWEATGHSPLIRSNGLTDTLALQWATTGEKVITVTATNGSGTVVDTRTTTLTSSGALIQFGAPTYQVNEDAGAAQILLQRRGTTSTALRVTVTTMDGSALATVDYEPIEQTFAFAPEQNAITLTVAITDDLVQEQDETFLLQLDQQTDEAARGTPAITTVTIIDNDQHGYLPVVCCTCLESYAHRR